MFEHRHKALLSRSKFVWRIVKFAAVALAMVCGSLAIGVLGYRYYEGMPWVDAFLNAAMIMGGMGPVGELRTRGGKLFAGFYALYCGMVFIVAIGIAFAPVFHRFLHHFHLEIQDKDSDKDPS